MRKSSHRNNEQIRSFIWDRVMPIPHSGCWIWMAYVGWEGYGEADVNQKRVKAHRLSWISHVGPIPGGMCVCHKCDVPSCVNPDHLFLGTLRDNNEDARRKGRMRGPVLPKHGERSKLSKLSDSDALAIYLSTDKMVDLAARYGVHPTTIFDIRHQRTRKYLTKGMAPRNRLSNPRPIRALKTPEAST